MQELSLPWQQAGPGVYFWAALLAGCVVVAFCFVADRLANLPVMPEIIAALPQDMADCLTEAHRDRTVGRGDPDHRILRYDLDHASMMLASRRKEQAWRADQRIAGVQLAALARATGMPSVVTHIDSHRRR